MSTFLSRKALAVIVGAALLFSALPRDAVADDLQDAIEAVKQASDDELLAELYDRRDRESEEPSRGGPTRSFVGPLKRFDDATLVKAIRFNNRGIYGIDDRRDWYEISDPALKKRAAASVALFPAASVKPGEGDLVQLSTVAHGTRQQLCSEELFADQGVGAFCSGTLVKDNVVLTAGHCVRELSNSPLTPAIKDTAFVFGFRIEAAGTPVVTSLPKGNVFLGKILLSGAFAGGRGEDWALVELDRAVPAAVAEPVTGWRSQEPSRNQSVFVIGYPSGLPLKYAPNAEIRDVRELYFTANLDTFGGNSGSGVYDQETQELVGILVRGDVDYVNDRAAGCTRVNVCPDSGCRGEEVTRIGIVKWP